MKYVLGFFLFTNKNFKFNDVFQRRFITENEERKHFFVVLQAKEKTFYPKVFYLR
jgi:hypothetical protein